MQRWIGGGLLLVAAGLGWGAKDIPNEAGYAGIGPSFFPWVITVGLGITAVMLLFGNRSSPATKDVAPTAEGADWAAAAWIIAGLALNAVLLPHIGFVLGCAICYAFAVTGLRQAQSAKVRGEAERIAILHRLKRGLTDLAVGVAISAPVYWLFGVLLKVKLPGLTNSGWL